MNEDTFGQKLSTWLREESEHRVPGHLDEVLVKTATVRQRPWWSSLERWLPMDLTTPHTPSFARAPRLAGLAILIVVGLVLLGLVALVAGSRRPLPEPFGLARNGAWVSSSGGDIYTVDPVTSVSKPLVIGEAAFDFSPVYSRDGSKLAFLRSDGPLEDPVRLAMMVMDANGSNLRELVPATASIDWFDWSPQGDRIAYMASGDLWVVALAGGPPTKLETGGSIHFPTWLPPDGREIIVRRETSTPAILAIRADGTGRRTISRAEANNQFDYQSIAVAPDGSAVTFTRWASDGAPRVIAMDPATGAETLFPTTAGARQRGPVVFSPNSKLVAYARVFPEGGFQIVLANADGSGDVRTLGARMPSLPDGSDVAATWAFVPDGTALFVRYGTDENGSTHLLPLDGSPESTIVSGSFNFVDVQRVAP
jgi:dipeptidyl aminopeptidase/acylaminoacyl peptidase